VATGSKTERNTFAVVEVGSTKHHILGLSSKAKKLVT